MNFDFKLPDFLSGLNINKLFSFLPFVNQKPPTLRLQVLPPTLHPIVIVPGFLGTWPSAFTAKGGKLDPVTGVYTNLIEGLKSIGYMPGVSLFPFPYDWRLGVEDLGAELGREIARIRQLSPLEAEKKSGVRVDYSQVDLLGHSMGGLVCRAYVQSDDYANDVSRLVLVATPNAGAVAAYYGFEGGETSYIGVPTASAKSMIGLLDARETGNLIQRVILTYQAVRGQSTYDMQDYLSHKTASVRDLLPLGRFNYLYSRNEAGQEKQVYPFGTPPGYPVNATIERLDSPAQLAQLDRVAEIYCFYSRSHGTRRRILVEDRYEQTKPLYQHGYPLEQPSESFAPGDTIVTEDSATLNLPDKKPDGSPWKVNLVNFELSTVLGTPLDHVQIVGDPAPVRYLLGYLTQCPAESPITPEIWDSIPLAQRKPNYAALFL